MNEGRPPELVIFDVDGTLHDVASWWPDLIRRGVQQFAAENSLALEVPDDDDAMAVVGEKLEGVWAPFLPAGEKHRWTELRSLVLPMEVAVLRSGGDFMFPGVRRLLEHLRELGLKVALASNCGLDYMEAMRHGQLLAELTDWQFCLATEGVSTKADMLRLALRAAGTDNAVMVGDRDNDLAAAQEVGLPFYWRVNDLCEPSPVAGRWHGAADELLSLLGLPGISSEGGE
ncbi:MAG: HAD family hydrolase [Planctomycetota bacterium]|jgi:phosphoglycolate phosphatase